MSAQKRIAVITMLSVANLMDQVPAAGKKPNRRDGEDDPAAAASIFKRPRGQPRSNAGLSFRAIASRCGVSERYVRKMANTCDAVGFQADPDRPDPRHPQDPLQPVSLDVLLQQLGVDSAPGLPARGGLRPGGTQPKVTPAIVDHVRVEVTARPELYGDELAASVQSTFGVMLSRATVSRILTQRLQLTRKKMCPIARPSGSAMCRVDQRCAEATIAAGAWSAPTTSNGQTRR